MNKGSIVERLCSDLDRKEPRYKSPTLLLLYRLQNMIDNTVTFSASSACNLATWSGKKSAWSFTRSSYRRRLLPASSLVQQWTDRSDQRELGKCKFIQCILIKWTSNALNMSHQYFAKKCVFRWRLKMQKFRVGSWRLSGSEFKVDGPATAKHRRPSITVQSTQTRIAQHQTF